MRTRPAVGLALVAWTLAGCAAGPEVRGPHGAAADTAAPRALLVRWHGALASADKAAYVGCFVGTEDELVLVLAAFEVVQATYAFHDAVVSAYGPEAWQVLEQAKGTSLSLWPRDPRWPHTITLARTGGAAFGYLARGRVPLVLSESGGVWRLHASGFVPPGFEARQAAEFLFRWAATLRELAPKVGEKRIQAERVQQTVTEDFRARLAPEEQAPAAAAVDFFMMH